MTAASPQPPPTCTASQPFCASWTACCTPRPPGRLPATGCRLPSCRRFRRPAREARIRLPGNRARDGWQHARHPRWSRRWPHRRSSGWSVPNCRYPRRPALRTARRQPHRHPYRRPAPPPPPAPRRSRHRAGHRNTPPRSRTRASNCRGDNRSPRTDGSRTAGPATADRAGDRACDTAARPGRGRRTRRTRTTGAPDGRHPAATARVHCTAAAHAPADAQARAATRPGSGTMPRLGPSRTRQHGPTCRRRTGRTGGSRHRRSRGWRRCHRVLSNP